MTVHLATSVGVGQRGEIGVRGTRGFYCLVLLSCSNLFDIIRTLQTPHSPCVLLRLLWDLSFTLNRGFFLLSQD